MNIKICASLLLATSTLMSANAQQPAQPQTQDLHKEITLEKDFVPVEKKAVKKNTLPVVKHAARSARVSTLSFSDWAVPTTVPTTSPTLMPYGYRTAHNFSDKRGYFDFGAGSQGNVAGSFGYRIIDTERTRLGFWLQHNSTWAGKNSSLMIGPEDVRNKQQFNDNVLDVNLITVLGVGTLDAGLNGHIDQFNYYGDKTAEWGDVKQTYHDVGLRARWSAPVTIADHDISYTAGLNYWHAGYAKAAPMDRITDEGWDLYDRVTQSETPSADDLDGMAKLLALPYNGNGARENALSVDLGGDFAITDRSSAGLDVRFDYLNRSVKTDLLVNKGDQLENFIDYASMFTLSPHYSVHSNRISLRLGLNVALSISDGAAVRLSPDVKLDVELAEGFGLFAQATGGKGLGYIKSSHFLNRYDLPTTIYSSVYTPVDAQAGFTIGPFKGFSAKLLAGFLMVNGSPNVCYFESDAPELYEHYGTRATEYALFDTQGFLIGADVNYRYRSLVDFSASIRYTPQEDHFGGFDHRAKGHDLGIDCPSTVFKTDVKVTPIRQLTVGLGFEYRGGRNTLARFSDGTYDYMDMADLLDLHANASYRLNRTITLWVQAGNLLNKRWDYLPGLGAQRLNAMGGVALVF